MHETLHYRSACHVFLLVCLRSGSVRSYPQEDWLRILSLCWRQPARLRSSAAGSKHRLSHYPDRMAKALYYCPLRRGRSALGSLRYFQAHLTPAHRRADQNRSRARRHSCYVGRGGMGAATTSAKSVVKRRNASNRAMERTTGRRTPKFPMIPTSHPAATRALASGGSSCSR
jgi:hypothetical protein